MDRNRIKLNTARPSFAKTILHPPHPNNNDQQNLTGQPSAKDEELPAGLTADDLKLIDIDSDVANTRLKESSPQLNEGCVASDGDSNSVLSGSFLPMPTPTPTETKPHTCSKPPPTQEQFINSNKRDVGGTTALLSEDTLLNSLQAMLGRHQSTFKAQLDQLYDLVDAVSNTYIARMRGIHAESTVKVQELVKAVREDAAEVAKMQEDMSELIECVQRIHSKRLRRE